MHATPGIREWGSGAWWFYLLMSAVAAEGLHPNMSVARGLSQCMCCLCLQVCERTCVHTCIACMCIYMRVCMCAHVYARIYMCAHVSACWHFSPFDCAPTTGGGVYRAGGHVLAPPDTSGHQDPETPHKVP